MPQILGRQVGVAVGKIRVEVVDDFPHCPRRCSGCFERKTKESQLGLVIGETPSGFAKAPAGLADFIYNCCKSHFRKFHYFSALLRKFERFLMIVCSQCDPTLACQLKSFRKGSSFVTRKLPVFLALS
ncbi:unnamed protein product [Haemonchus placei]|uniref:Uncharacterized protein n=1 Tax=Haemonchus placei TaxID=6290 RepID=A0A3P7Y9U6_HAEPC|nr:unnamed protein product [Haemonchus placei]